MYFFKREHTYLDWASSAPVSRAARHAFDRALQEYGNPSSPHAKGNEARRLLEDARTTIARLAEVKLSGVVFTSGATEANNLALTGLVIDLKANDSVQDPIHILYLPSMHASVIETLKSLMQWGVTIEPLVITNGRVDIARLVEQLRPETKLVTLDAVCGETGTIWNLREVRNVLASFAKEKNLPQSLIHVDASQAPLALPWSLMRLSADMLTLDAQKVGGIRGVGALCVRSHVHLSPVLHGGGQEGRLRPGTEPVALIASFAAALEEAERTREPFSMRAERIRTSLVKKLSTHIPDMTVTVGNSGVPHILNLSFPGRDTDYAVMLLSQEGFMVSSKSACESDSEEGSRAILALTKDDARARSTLRISWGPSTRERDLARFAPTLVRTIHFLDEK